MILQLNPPLWLHTPKGEALAHFLVDRGIEHDNEWICIQQETGEIWSWRNQDVRAMKNVTQGRTPSEIHICPDGRSCIMDKTFCKDYHCYRKTVESRTSYANTHS